VLFAGVCQRHLRLRGTLDFPHVCHLAPPGGGLACHLLPTTEGCQVCTAEPSCENPDFPPCASTADCAAGSVCLGDPYCHVCVRICASA
jgi:hypothetical protein